MAVSNTASFLFSMRCAYFSETCCSAFAEITLYKHTNSAVQHNRIIYTDKKLKSHHYKSNPSLKLKEKQGDTLTTPIEWNRLWSVHVVHSSQNWSEHTSLKGIKTGTNFLVLDAYKQEDNFYAIS